MRKRESMVRLPDNRWGKGLEGMTDEEAIGIIMLILSKMKSAKYLTFVAVGAGISLSTIMDMPIQDVLDAIRLAVDEWDDAEVAERRAMMMSTADQMEASYSEFKERVYEEGVEPHGSSE